MEALTRDHFETIQTVDGLERHTSRPLLTLLHDAVLEGAASDHAGGGLKTKLPLAVAALDLWRDICGQVAFAYRREVAAPCRVSDPWRNIALWAAKVQPDTLTMVSVDRDAVYADKAVAEWERRIRAYFRPPRVAPINAPCIACGERYQYRLVDGQSVRAAAMQFVRNPDTGDTLRAECGSCGSVWLPSQFEFLARSIGKQSELVNHG